ncbi:hypothetical protein V2J09_001260 [Rumex salicifolius]
MTSTGTNLVMTVIGFTVSTLFIVFICTRLICARIQLRAARRSFRISSRSDLGTLERGVHRIDVPVLANFPAKQFSDNDLSSNENAQCAVCLAEYRKEDIVRILPQCSHYFHMNCIDKWLLQNSTCPVCRVSLRNTNDKKCTIQPLFSSRSHYTMDPSNVHTYQCLLSARRSQSSSHGDQMNDPHREDQCSTRNDTEEEAATPNPIPLGENRSCKELGDETVESRSCA